MADTLRVRSNLPMRFSASEPLSSEFADKPGLAPARRSVELRPGINEFSGADAEVYGLWAKANPQMTADADAVKAGNTTGLVYQLDGDEPDVSFGFQPALDAASTAGAADGSTVKDPGPVKASDMKPTSDAPADDSPRSNPPNPASNPGPVAVAPAAAPKPATASAPAAVPAK